MMGVVFLLWIALVYVLCGLAVGVPFVMRGVQSIDPAAAGTSWLFRLLLLPGSVALWPWLVRKWRMALRQATEKAP